MDSLKIFGDRSWYRFSRRTNTGVTGGDAIAFVMEFSRMNFQDSVRWLLEFSGDYQEPGGEMEKSVYSRKKEILVLPARSWTADKLMHYLHDIRKITEETINEMMELGILYESYPNHDLVFIGCDKNGEARYATLHGTGEKNFKKDVPGSEKEYGVHVDRSNADTIVVTEAAIDLLSYLDLETDRVNILALGGLFDSPLERYLKDHDSVQHIILALDNDAPGKEAAEKYTRKYRELGFGVSGYSIPETYKDLNEYLQKLKTDRTVGRWCGYSM
jgi:DNA primase